MFQNRDGMSIMPFYLYKAPRVQHGFAPIETVVFTESGILGSYLGCALSQTNVVVDDPERPIFASLEGKGKVTFVLSDQVWQYGSAVK